LTVAVLSPSSVSLGGFHNFLSSGDGSLQGTWAKSLHGTFVSKWVLLLTVVHSGWGSGISEDRLDLIGVDDSLDISIREAWSLEREVG
jgi:hypothetical protein